MMHREAELREMDLLLRRSVHATPASKPWMFDKAAKCGADLVYLDLEDAVAPAIKEKARSQAVEGLRGCNWGRTTRAVRINALDTHWAHDDIIGVVSSARDAVDTLIIPKVRSAREVWWVDVLLSQIEAKLRLRKEVRLQAIIECVDGLANVEDIARSSKRLDALHFGAGDYAVSQGSRVDTNLIPVYPHDGDLWHYARTRILVAARIAGLLAIDAVYPNYRDSEGFESAAMRAASLGYSGKGCIHPDQVAIANQVFRPTESEVVRARAQIQAYSEAEEAGQGAVGLDNSLIDAAHLRLAREVLAEAEIAERNDVVTGDASLGGLLEPTQPREGAACH